MTTEYITITYAAGVTLDVVGRQLRRPGGVENVSHDRGQLVEHVRDARRGPLLVVGQVLHSASFVCTALSARRLPSSQPPTG